ncbi:hypothetical protein [Clostridium botulinum]|uniref:hypothetical protein n=1 Tax=Clostridium botulinum TaxID=1491 RepID=UPI001C9AB7EB|nr:hypothetical protein [Clostridium botulinum]MBY6967510.1 hypothetical protein [Clostridium botulinum]
MAGAMLFYYLNLLLDVRKKYTMYDKFRYILLDILYCNIKEFDCLNKTQVKKVQDFEQIKELNKEINKIPYIENEEDVEYLGYLPTINSDIKEFLLDMEDKDLIKSINYANRKLKNIKKYSTELEFYNNEIRNLTKLYDDELSSFINILNLEPEDIDLDKCKKIICVVYIKYLQQLLDLFSKFSKFIKVLYQRDIIKFIIIANKNMKGNILEDI